MNRKEVMKATLSVLDALNLNYTFAEAGDECLEINGEPLPENNTIM